MTDNGLCKLCQDNLAINIDLKVEAASLKLLQRLLKSYQIDASILKERSSICEQCFDVVLEMSKTLEKWSKAQEVLKASPLDIDDSKIFQVKLEPGVDPQFLEIQVEPLQIDSFLCTPDKEPQMVDVEFIENAEDLVEDVSSEDSDTDESTEEADTDWRSSLENFFCVCLGPDGLALTILFKDKTKEKNIRMLCTCCNQLFDTLSDIHKHASVTRTHPEFWCGVCEAIYPSNFELKIHEKIKRHSRPKTRAMVMRCLKCGTRSKHLSDAIKHENEVHDRSSFLCHKCKVSFECRESFQKHLLKHQSYVCRYLKCPYRFRLLSDYAKHLAWHKNHKSPCPIDGCIVIMDPVNHDQHLRTHLATKARGKVGMDSCAKMKEKHRNFNINNKRKI